ncbi:hypothetical protein LTR84_011091 [Exophiala bonariae]|uniref:histone acetyltransferase n=1 Tax=Exophiala bonariae TaxID=1690606 RepID=A0AAV9NJ96_9EURO|nr:hypothetical protein LTR84_011091 [Exophiala bonariae]
MLDRLPLSTRLAAAIPSGVNLSCYHISTQPVPSAALFSPVPSQPDQATTCESHFLAISSPEDGEKKELLIFAVEILIFATPTLTFIFVSKADSSGFSSRLPSPKNAPSIVATVTSTFIDFLLDSRLHNQKVVVSLFARAQNQYLFPGSSDNSGKHVLDDRQLIKWWSRVLDRTMRHHHHDPAQTSKVVAHLVVPGCDQAETKAFFPPATRQNPISEPKWFSSYPVDLLVQDASQPPRFLIPRLPDDPKARFLDDLDNDFIDNQGQWRSVKSLRDFWEMMSYRQECSAGRLVGFIWMIFSRGQASRLSRPPANQAAPQLTTPEASQVQETLGTEPQLMPGQQVSTTAGLKSPPPSSPVQDSFVDSQNTDDTGLLDSNSFGSEIGTDLAFERDAIESTKGQVVVNTDQYDQLMDFMLQTDFTGEDLAAESTRGWINKILEISKASTIGYQIRGESIVGDSLKPGAGTSIPPPVNVLTNIRKKRKADQEDRTSKPAVNEQTSLPVTVNTLATSLVRKKPKT